MRKNKTSFLGYLFRWFIATAVMASAVIAVVHFKSSLLQPSGKDAQPDPRRVLTPAQLIASIDERLELERARCTALERSLAEAMESFEDIGTPVTFTSGEVNERRRELVRYADLVNANEGVILDNGDYISSSALRNRAVRRRAELAAITKQIHDSEQFTLKTTGTVRELEKIRTRRNGTVAELELLRTSLVEKVNLLATKTASGQKSDLQSLSSLRKSVARMQDMVEVRLEMAEEDSPNGYLFESAASE